MDRINIEIQIARDKLNMLMKDDFRTDYEEVLSLSKDLDKLLNKYTSLIQGNY